MKVSPKQYAKLLFEVGSSEGSSEDKEKRIAKIAGFLIKNRDQKKMRKIEFEFEKMLVAEGRKLSITIESARKLEQQQIDEIKQAVAKERKISAEVIEIKEKVEPKLLGGLRLTVGNEIIDSSLAAKVGMLKKSLSI